jgi:type I restriction enzyme R subunit
MERKRRVELVRQDYLNTLSKKQQQFYNLIVEHYVRQGFKELAMENLKDFIRIQYGSPLNATQELMLNPAQIYQQYLEFQHRLYHC